jgi:uncharacterized repeat protein (TIGR04076 family)
MTKCKITVLKRMYDEALSSEYCASPIRQCPILEDGQTFISDFNPPAGFCNWAWNDILKYVTALLSGGNFSNDIFKGWMKEDNNMIVCCTDGIRPVVFKLERIEVEE